MTPFRRAAEAEREARRRGIPLFDVQQYTQADRGSSSGTSSASGGVAPASEQPFQEGLGLEEGPPGAFRQRAVEEAREMRRLQRLYQGRNLDYGTGNSQPVETIEVHDSQDVEEVVEEQEPAPAASGFPADQILSHFQQSGDPQHRHRWAALCITGLLKVEEESCAGKHHETIARSNRASRGRIATPSPGSARGLASS